MAMKKPSFFSFEEVLGDYVPDMTTVKKAKGGDKKPEVSSWLVFTFKGAGGGVPWVQIMENEFECPADRLDMVVILLNLKR